MTDIYTEAFNAYKPNKQTVADLIVELYEGTSDPTMRERLAGAYKYFQPAQPAKPKNLWQWVAQAVSNDPHRPFIHNVWCDGEFAVATDGHRLHMIPCKNAPGYYTVDGHRMDGLDEQWTFPDYKRVIPQGLDYREISIDTSKVERSPVNDKLYWYPLNDGFSIDKRYFDQAVGFFTSHSATWDGTKNPVRFDMADGAVAVVILIRKAK